MHANTHGRCFNIRYLATFCDLEYFLYFTKNLHNKESFLKGFKIQRKIQLICNYFQRLSDILINIFLILQFGSRLNERVIKVSLHLGLSRPIVFPPFWMPASSPRKSAGIQSELYQRPYVCISNYFIHSLIFLNQSSYELLSIY